jgi:membrane-bound serine protease (ClpP class)
MRGEHMRLAVLTLLLGLLLTAAVEAQPVVNVIKIDSAIGPVTARFISREIERAETDGAACLIIEMDTPGGLDSSMRSIIQAILASRVPVVVYVAPAGARCASAGVFIAMSADVVAMTPGTSIGAAHPVTVGGGEVDEHTMAKIVNDSASYIKGLAERKGRNAEWAEKAVRESATATAEEALELGVIDMVVDSLEDLVVQLNGRKFDEAKGGELDTEGAQIRNIDMGGRYRLLDLLSNPNVAYILLILGFYGIFFELSNPGSIFPGVVGAVFLILAFFSFQMLPINYAGVLLIVLGLVLFIAEVKITSGGMLTVGGTVCMFLGSIMLIESPAPFLRISFKVIIPAVLSTALFFIFAVGAGIRAQRRKPTTGREGLIGERGVTTTDVDGGEGQAFIHGELWSVESGESIGKGEVVEVVSMRGLKLIIKRAGAASGPEGRD